MPWREFDRAVGQAPRLVEPAEPQSGTAQRVVVPTAIGDEASGRLTFEEWLSLAEPVQRLARFAKLRQCPGGGGDRGGKLKDDVSRAHYRNPVLDQCPRLGPVALEEAERPCGEVGPADGMRVLRRFGEPNRLGFVLGGFGESAELGKAHGQVGAIEDRGGTAMAKILGDPVGGQCREVVRRKLDPRS